MFGETVVDLSNLKGNFDFEEEVIIEGSKKGDLSSLFKGNDSCDSVQSVQLDYECEVDDLSLLSNFPNLESILLIGPGIPSFRGIEHLANLNTLVLEGVNSDNCDYSTLPPLSLEFFHTDSVEDPEKIAISSKIRSKNVKIIGEDSGDLAYLSRVGANNLILGKSRFSKISGFEDIDCADLSLINCPNFRSFESKKEVRLRRFEAESCGSLDYEALFSTLECKIVRISSCKGTIKLSDLLSIRGLKKVTLNGVEVICDLIDIDFENLSLEEAKISPISKKDLSDLKKSAGTVEWTAG